MGNTTSSTDKVDQSLFGTGPDTMFTIKHAELGTCLQPVGSDPNPNTSGTKLQLTSDCSQTAVNRFRRLTNGAIMHSSGWCITPSGSDLQLYGDCSSSPWVFRGGDESQFPGAITDREGKLCWASGDTADKQNNVTLTADCSDGWITAGVDCTKFTGQIPGFRYSSDSGFHPNTAAPHDDWSWNIGYDSSGATGAPLDTSYDSFTEDDVIKAFGIQGIGSSSRVSSPASLIVSPQSQVQRHKNINRNLLRRHIDHSSESVSAAQAKNLFKVELPSRPEASCTL